MKKLKKVLIIGLSVLVVSGTSAAIYSSLQSDLFMVNGVEIEGSLKNPPLTHEDVMKLAGVPLGRVSIFSLDLKRIETQLLSHEWIQHVRLMKKPKHTLNIFITYKQPRAMIQGKKGSLSYVDADGKAFGTYSPEHSYDLPLLVGFSDQDRARIHEALKIGATWESHAMSKISAISSILWDPDRGYRVLVSYAMSKQAAEDQAMRSAVVRTMVDLGTEADVSLKGKLDKLVSVFQYLGEHSIAVRQVWSDLGKKVVVKTISDS